MLFIFIGVGAPFLLQHFELHPFPVLHVVLFRLSAMQAISSEVLTMCLSNSKQIVFGSHSANLSIFSSSLVSLIVWKKFLVLE